MILLKVPMSDLAVILAILFFCMALYFLVYIIRSIPKLPKIPKDAREVIFFRDFESIENNMKTQLKSEPV